MIIRQAQKADATAIAKIHVRSWQRAYRGIMPDSVLNQLSIDAREESWLQQIGRAGQQTFVSSQGYAVLGFITFGAARESDPAPKDGEIYALYVDPDNWQCGIGSALWNHALQHLVSSGFERALVWVLETNTRARRFYETLGCVLQPNAQKTLEYHEKHLVEVCYILQLGVSK